jgi:hypothetical protein
VKPFPLSIALLTLVAAFLLAGCGSKSDPTESPAAPTPELSSPIEQESLASPLVPPRPTQPSHPTVVPEPDQGIVTGTLRQTGDIWSLTGQPIYLSGFVALDSEQTDFEVVRIDAASDPRAIVNADGTFMFTSIAPSRYALATVTPRGENVLIIDLDTGKEIIIEVKAGEITDLGEVSISLGY